MNQELITQLFELVLIPLLIALTSYAVKWLNAKSEETKAKIENDMADKYIDMLNSIIVECVLTTNQTYVDSLKQQGAFDAAAQQKAFQLTSEAVMEILNEEAKKCLSEMVGDLEKYVTSKIEAQVKLSK